MTLMKAALCADPAALLGARERHLCTPYALAVGAWGHGPFENDDALDWLADFEEAGIPRTLEATLFPITAIEDDLYLEAPDASEAVAAAEVVAALRGNGHPFLAKRPVMGWVAANGEVATNDLVRMAQQAVRRVQASSELRDLWEEAGELDAWNSTLDDLLARLTLG
jgi:hypothetical protein